MQCRDAAQRWGQIPSEARTGERVLELGKSSEGASLASWLMAGLPGRTGAPLGWKPNLGISSTDFSGFGGRFRMASFPDVVARGARAAVATSCKRWLSHGQHESCQGHAKVDICRAYTPRNSEEGPIVQAACYQKPGLRRSTWTELVSSSHACWLMSPSCSPLKSAGATHAPDAAGDS